MNTRPSPACAPASSSASIISTHNCIALPPASAPSMGDREGHYKAIHVTGA